MLVKKTDVLVVGSGGAGVAAAVEAAKNGASVVVISKEPVGYGDTRLSLGVMSTGVDTEAGDSEQQFTRDMIEGGARLNNPELVRVLVGEAMQATVAYEDYGHIFDRDGEGKMKRMPVAPGGHSAPRAVGGPGYGIQMGQALRAAAARSSIEVLEDTVCSELLLYDGEVAGAVALQMKTGRPVAVVARSTVIATGGAGALFYPHTDCQPSVAGDGYALALKAGAELVDMEQVQLIPFALTHPRSLIGVVVGEPVIAGPFGRLLDCRGDLVLDNMMNMTRAEVANVMMEAIERGGATEHGGLLLDLKPNIDSEIGEFYSTAVKAAAGEFLRPLRRAYGRRAADFLEPWDVLPSVHYFMGGIRTDEHCRSRVRGLYACGQVQGGVMGGNRLGSTSLTEIVVFGKRAGKTAALEARSRGFADEAIATEAGQRLGALLNSSGEHRPVQLTRRLQKLMWERVGPRRHREGLSGALDEIQSLKVFATDLSLAATDAYNREALDALELDFMLATAEAIALSALAREESRGAHVRSDFPASDERFAGSNTVVAFDRGACRVELREAG